MFQKEIEQFDTLMVKYKFTNPVSQSVQQVSLAARNRVIHSTLKQVGNYNIFYKGVLKVYIGSMKYGFKFSLLQAKVVLISLITGAILLTGGSTYAVIHSLTQKIIFKSTQNFSSIFFSTHKTITNENIFIIFNRLDSIEKKEQKELQKGIFENNKKYEEYIIKRKKGTLAQNKKGLSKIIDNNIINKQDVDINNLDDGKTIDDAHQSNNKKSSTRDETDNSLKLDEQSNKREGYKNQDVPYSQVNVSHSLAVVPFTNINVHNIVVNKSTGKMYHSLYNKLGNKVTLKGKDKSGAAKLLLGSIWKIGDKYTLQLKLVNVKDSKVIWSTIKKFDKKNETRVYKDVTPIIIQYLK